MSVETLRESPPRWRARIAGVASALALAACGGGDEALYVPDPTIYVSWAGSSNGIYVEDATGGYYMVRADDDAVVSYRSGGTLAGLSVVGVDIIVRGEGAVGVVRLYDGSGGRRYAEFACDDGRYFDIIESSSGWTYACL